jgi:NAD+ synthase (glutamine-hydrolysing)
MDYREHGFFRVAAVAPELALADPQANAERLIDELQHLQDQAVAIALFPELALTGYSCEDLFFNDDLHTRTQKALARVAEACQSITGIVGLPWQLRDGRLLNCAAVLQGGRILGLVPKSAHPNYAEFYEQRWFTAGQDVSVPGPFLIDHRQIFEVGGARIAIEICEDLWSPEPPGVRHCLAGAEIVLNLSASNELVAKADYRRDLVRMTSARAICGYLYASSGPLESTKDIVFGGHLIAAENGRLIDESERFSLQGNSLVTEFDLKNLRHDRMQNTTFSSARRPDGYTTVSVTDATPELSRLHRTIDAHPFVPSDEAQIDARASEILNIQATGLARRVLAAGSDALVIGLSGGLDSTLAFLVCLDAVKILGRGVATIHPLTLPGPGTTEHTRLSAHGIAQAAGASIREISIVDAVAQHLLDLQHTDETDTVFENAQARERTQILFNYANKVGGIVVGTGDLSELALGWCTYNADHMAGYNVNASVPKTMMGYLVRWYARHRADDALLPVLQRVLDTPISPELIAPRDGAISQQTEAIIGPYELHDFFLYQFMRNGAGVAKIFDLANLAFADSYAPEVVHRWLRVFFSRFFSQQFKRTTLPPGPKVGSVSLSPRGDWRMPAEVSAQSYLASIDALLDTPDQN